MGRHRASERLARYHKRKRAGFPVVVSEGDSWFSYELFPNIIDLIDDDEMFAHLRLEMSGDTVANMLGERTALDSLAEVVHDEGALFLLFSGGGNDMQNNASRLFQDRAAPEDCLVTAVADEMFGMLRSQIEMLIKTVGPEVPVVAHGYDFFQPSDEPVRIAGFSTPIGPWFHPEMVKAGITDAAQQRAIADIMVTRFNDDLAALKAENGRSFVYVKLLGTLDPDTEWENEIHPTREGFRKVTDKIVEAISTDVRQLLIQRRESP